MFISEIKDLFMGFTEGLSGGDSTVKGFITLWLLGVFSWFFKSVPSKVLTFIKQQSLISVTLNKDDDIENITTAVNVEKWLIEHNKFILRNRAISSEDKKTTELIGYGNHIFFCKGRLIKIIKTKENKSGVSKTIETLVLTTFGRKIDFLSEIVKNARPDQNLRYFCLLGEGWQEDKNRFFKKVAIIKDIPFLSINEDLKNQIDITIDFFVNNKDFYIKNNLAYKLVFVLHGEPGTGKSSIIKYVAERLKTNIISLHPFLLTSIYLSEKFLSLNDAEKPSVICFEDFENFAASRDYKKLVKEKRKKEYDTNENSDTFGDDITSVNNDISSLLNLLQGVQPLENIVLFLTTNYIERVDKAAIRAGRVDFNLEVKRLDFKAIKKYYEYVYSKEFPADVTHLNPVKACDMEDAFRKNPFNPENFIKTIQELN